MRQSELYEEPAGKRQGTPLPQNVSPGMFTLEATEHWRAGWWSSEQREALLTEQDFELDIGGRHRHERPVYRKIYHTTAEDDTLVSLSGTLHYRPFPDLTLSPIELEVG